MNQSDSYFLPHVSILISTKDRRFDLEKALNSVKKINYPWEKFEIVVVEETDSPKLIEGVKYISIPREGRGFGYTRNVAIKNASYKIVAFTDDDCIVDRDWLLELVQLFRDEEVAGVAGGVRLRDAGIIGKCEIILGFPGGGLKYLYYSRGIPYGTSHLSTCNCAYRKKVFEEIGYFNEDTKHSGEDYELALRVSQKYRCLYNPKAIVYHKPRGTISGIFKWFIRRGNTQISIMDIDSSNYFKHLWWLFKTSLFLRAVLFYIFFSLFHINPLIGFSVLLIPYWIFTVLRYSFYYLYYPELRIALVLPAVKLVMDTGMDVGKIEGVLRYWRRR
jgi:cellulose synthase/poly-beta-1,6-N-acetylglucosamine synthase-like glycosyltransferase